MNIFDPNPNTNQRMNCLRNKTVCEIHLIFYLILTIILCTSIVSYIYYQNNQLKQKCGKQCLKPDNCSESHSTVVIDRSEEYNDLNYQPFINDRKINSLVVKSRNTIELMRNTLNIPCILVGISINGTDLWAEGMGYSDVENGVKCHKHSAFSLGSMSKPMISLLIASQIDSGKLNLDESIKDINFDESYPQIYHAHENSNSSYLLTLRQLMSEMPVIQIKNSTEPYIYCGDSPAFVDVYGTPFSDAKLRFYQSILSWYIITDRLESSSVLNQSFPSAINDFLFRKINLVSTGLKKEHSIVPYSVRYYNKNGSELQNYASGDDIPVDCWPSSAITSTISEVLMFGRKVIDVYEQKPNSTINSSTFRQFISRQTQHPTNQDIYYGLGWMLFDSANETSFHSFGYSGQTSGSSYLFMVRPENDFVITLLANLGGVEQELHKLARLIINNFKSIFT